MKSVVSPFGTSTNCLRIVCTGGLVIRVTQHPTDLLMTNGVLYQTGSGFDFTGLESAASLSPSAIDLEGILGFAGVTRERLASGVFDGSRAYLFACDYLNPVEDHEPIVASLLGKATLTDDSYRIEEMGLIDALNQSVGMTYTAACRHRLGDAGCGISLPALTVSGVLTAVTSRQLVRDGSRTEGAGHFVYGALRFTSGVNAGLRPIEVRRHEADGTIELFEPFYYMPSVGDTYTMTPGCLKSLGACRDKFNNVINFGGFPNMPTSSIYGERGTQ